MVSQECSNYSSKDQIIYNGSILENKRYTCKNTLIQSLQIFHRKSLILLNNRKVKMSKFRAPGT